MERVGSGAWWAVAAALLIVVVGGWWALRDDPERAVVEVAGRVDEGGNAIVSGTTLVADEPLALRLADGPSLRIDGTSEVRIVTDLA